jgi:VCBS repeat-containing protein
VDTVAPNLPAISPIGGLDNLVSSQPGDAVVSGQAEADSTVTVTFGASNLGTATANTAGNWSYVLNAANIAVIGQGIGKTLTATATDAAANRSTVAISPSFAVDTKALPPAALSLAPASDSGTKGDNITNIGLTTITGGGENGATVTLRNGSTAIGTGTVTAGVWSITVATALAEGANVITATQTDAAGNTSAASAALNVTLDTTVLPPGALALAPASDSGSNGHDVTNADLPTITGSGEDGATVTLFDGTTAIGTGTVSGGVWSITALTALTEGPNAITATQTDAAGNISAASAALSTTLDTPGAVQGPHGQYVVADDNGALYVQDTVTGRDGTQTPAGNQMVFSDGIGVLDPTGTAEDVLRLYQAALGRAPDAGGLNYWTGDVDNSHASLADVAAGLAASPEFIRSYPQSSGDTAFVQQVYQNVLGRPVDGGGAQFWQGQLASGVSRGQVLVGFAESPENRARTLSTAGDKNDAEAYRLYQAALNRAPDQAGQSYWSSVLANGATPSQVAQDFIASDEFGHKFGALSASDFVSALYQNVLHRAGDAGGQQFWTNALDQGTSRADLLVGFSDGLENRVQTAGATHDGWVFIHA